jgi:hypothetical protein
MAIPLAEFIFTSNKSALEALYPAPSGKVYDVVSNHITLKESQL